MYNCTTYFEVTKGKHLKLSNISCVFLCLIINGQYLLLNEILSMVLIGFWNSSANAKIWCKKVYTSAPNFYCSINYNLLVIFVLISCHSYMYVLKKRQCHRES